jgi:hypothetical protein
MKISPILLGLSLAVAGNAMAAAQDASSAKPPAVISIEREFIKPGKSGLAHDKTEAAFVTALNKGKLQGHYIALNSMSGKSRALYITRYPSFAAWEADNKIVDKDAALGAELDRAAVADGDLLDSTDAVIATYDEELSYHPHPDISHARYYEITVFRVKPGHHKDFVELTKMVKEAQEKGGTSAHWATYDVAYGTEDGTYIVLSADKSMSDIDQGMSDEKKFVQGIGGEEGMAKLDKLFGEIVIESRSELFAVNPKQSYPDEQWIKGDPDFWKPKAEAAVKSTKPATAAAAKPAAAAPAAPKPASR